jgi:hypothetical protein
LTIPVDAGEEYTASFYAKVDRPGVALDRLVTTAVWTVFPVQKKIPLTTQWKRYHLSFRVAKRIVTKQQNYLFLRLFLSITHPITKVPSSELLVPPVMSMLPSVHRLVAVCLSANGQLHSVADNTSAPVVPARASMLIVDSGRLSPDGLLKAKFDLAVIMR